MIYFEKTDNYVTVLFYLHLSIEKMLKSFYVSTMNKHAPFSHNLIFLSKEVNLEINDTDRILLSEINEFNIESRYPDHKFSIYKIADRDFTRKYLNEGNKFRKWILHKLEKKLYN